MRVIADIDRGPLDHLVREWATTHQCPSISWGIVSHGTLMLTGGAGTVDGHAPDPDTAYRIASMTKSFSAAATLLLRDEGQLILDAPIAEFAPELSEVRAPTDDAAPVTVRDLLAMTSGLVSDDAWADRHLDLTDVGPIPCAGFAANSGSRAIPTAPSSPTSAAIRWGCSRGALTRCWRVNWRPGSRWP